MKVINLFHSKPKTITIVFFIGVLFIGVAITKLSVRDRIILTDEEKSCAQTSILQQFDHPFQRIALAFGKSAVIGKQKNALVVKSYTIFRIPLPTTRLFNKYTQQIICDWAVEPREMPEISQDAAEFTKKIQGFVVENFGQPIDSGFTAPMYLQAFPGLLEADFDGVETSEGKYEYSGGELAFIKTPTGRYSTFDEAILEKGHQTLLGNIRGRLGPKLSVDEIIKGIIAQGIGRVNGTILLGPTCPVMKDPPDPKCADKPIFGEFIVQNAMGSIEFARFGTQKDGSFSVPLPAGEYYITWAEPRGPGIQGHLVNVRTGETSVYTITFDTGIR